ncbi:Lymphocyte antigen 6K [Heterocephalus glaber]|uniref:Lymphocyte antigen 6K n=1 Tax=Heterocephalus glaber TaxID=10181 RepID=G5C8Y1_HETGA|nr:Lymphocyte antigen 6K [Heterocephalus glaber]
MNTSEMQLLLALFLFLGLGLQQVETDNQTKRQGDLKCYICEGENSFDCATQQTCGEAPKYCALTVIKIFARFFLISKQCVVFCPAVVNLGHETPKQFLLEKPMPFVHIRCCTESLCKMEGPDVPEETFREQIGRAYKRRCSLLTVSTLLTVMSTAFSGLGVL